MTLERRRDMEGMRNKDYLNGQEMSTVFVDDLLANMEDEDDFIEDYPSSENKNESSQGGTSMRTSDIFAEFPGERTENRSEGAEIVNISKAMSNMSTNDKFVEDKPVKNMDGSFETPLDDVNLSDIDAMMASIKAEMPENVFDIPIDSSELEEAEEDNGGEMPDYIGEFLAKEKAAKEKMKEEAPKDIANPADGRSDRADNNMIRDEKPDFKVETSIEHTEKEAFDDEDDFDFDENPIDSSSFDDEIKIEEFDRAPIRAEARPERNINDEIKIEEFDRPARPSEPRVGRRFDDEIRVEEFDRAPEPSAPSATSTRIDRRRDDKINVEEFDYTVKPSAARPDRVYEDAIKAEESGADYTVKPFAAKRPTEKFSDALKNDDFGFESRVPESREGRRFSDVMKSEEPDREPKAYTTRARANRDAIRSEEDDHAFRSDYPIKVSAARTDSLGMDTLSSERPNDSFESLSVSNDNDRDTFRNDRDTFRNDRREDTLRSGMRNDAFRSERLDDAFRSERQEDAFESLSVNTDVENRATDKIRSTEDTFASSERKSNVLDMDAMISAAEEEDRLAFEEAPVFEEVKNVRPEPVAQPIAQPVVQPVAEPVIQPVVQPVAKKPEEKLDSVLEAEVDALTVPSANAELAPAIMSIDDAIDGITKDMQNFLDTEDYDYTYVWAGSTETIIMKTIEGKAVALVYEDEEFAAFEDSYTRDNRTSYLAIVNSYVKETIKGGSGIRIKRHKGSKAIDR